MSNIIERPAERGALMENVLIKGDLGKLTPQERSDYYLNVCQSVGLNPLTKPFEYITLNGKLTLYARRDAADQLRKINGISVEIVSREIVDGILTVHVRAKDASGRTDEDFGCVSVAGLKGETAANAKMKAVTKAKRRVTLSISGLGFLDETEVDEIPLPPIRRTPPHNHETGEIIESISDEQVKELITLINESGADQVRFLNYLRERKYLKADDGIDALPVPHFAAAKTALESKRQKQ